MNKDEILFQKIIEYAKSNDNIRIVAMNGSRVNPNIDSDQYQDYDIVFYVKNYLSFIEDDLWLNNFGTPLLSQTSKDQRDVLEEDSYIYMMQYSDGSRLDLSIVDFKRFTENIREDSLVLILIDKEGMNLNIIPDESSYYVKPIIKSDFDYCVNEFYWVVPYVAKGIARKQNFYAYKHLDIIRNELERMIDWWIGHQHNYQVSVGKGKSRYIEYLPKDLYQKYVLTYSDTEESNLWAALNYAIELFDELAKELARIYDFSYNNDLKNQVMIFLKENYSK